MADKKFKYSEYCTVFWFEENGKYKVQMYDEIKDRPLKTVTVPDKESARKLLQEYVDNAPQDAICQKLD